MEMPYKRADGNYGYCNAMAEHTVHVSFSHCYPVRGL
jgi:hypothetical protein